MFMSPKSSASISGIPHTFENSDSLLGGQEAAAKSALDHLPVKATWSQLLLPFLYLQCSIMVYNWRVKK